MILNNTKNRITGVIKDPDIKKDYSGLTTETAKVTVDPYSKEISVDVLPRGFLGTDANQAYPGNKGDITRKLAVETRNELEQEILRSVKQDDQLGIKLEVLAENQEYFKSYSKSTYATKTDLKNLDTKVKQDIQPTIDSIVTDIDSIESNYATKQYVHEEIHDTLTLSKQLVDYVNVKNNTVTMNGIVSSPVDGVLYMVKDTSIDVSDVYKEYTTINGKLTLIGDTSIDLSGYATEEFVTSKIDSIPEVDLTPYAKKTDIPDVSSFIAEIPEEYVTDSELTDKGYYTQENVTTLLTGIKFIDGGNAASMLK